MYLSLFDHTNQEVLQHIVIGLKQGIVNLLYSHLCI